MARLNNVKDRLVRKEADTITPSTLLLKINHTYDVEGEVGAAAHLASGVFGTAVVNAVIIRTGTGESQRSLFIVDLVTLLC